MNAWILNISMELKLSLRDRQAIFWSFLFPLFFLFIFATIFGRTSPKGVTGLMPGLLTISSMAAGFFGLSIGLVTARERGLLRRYRVAPVRGWLIVSSHLVSNFLIALASLIIQLALAKAVYQIDIAGSVVSFLAVLSAGLLAFMSIGLVVASLAENTKVALVVSNILFYPLMFLGGATLPTQMLSPALQSVSKMLPSNYMVRGLSEIILDGRGASLRIIAVLMTTAIVGIVVAGAMFRWESTEPLSMAKRALAAAVVAVFILAALIAR
ncbi:MAG: ABC transporter permease [Acidobacteriota bacterium]